VQQTQGILQCSHRGAQVLSMDREVVIHQSKLQMKTPTQAVIEAHGDQGVNRVLHQRCKELVTQAHNLLSRREVSARQDAMTYLVG